MATCFALTYQSVLLEDGMAEYMTFIRGIVIVAIQMYCRGARLLFGHLLGDKSKEALQPHMEGLPLIEADWVGRAVKGIAGLGPLVEGMEVEGRYWELIGEMGRMLGVSSWKGKLFLFLWGWTSCWFTTDFVSSIPRPDGTLRLVDDAPPRAVPAAGRPDQPGGAAAGLALDRARADHGRHLRSGAAQRGGQAAPRDPRGGHQRRQRQLAQVPQLADRRRAPALQRVAHVGVGAVGSGFGVLWEDARDLKCRCVIGGSLGSGGAKGVVVSVYFKGVVVINSFSSLLCAKDKKQPKARRKKTCGQVPKGNF